MDQPTNEELAKWFVESGAWGKLQSPDGFMYHRDREKGEYLYIWVMAHVDLDLEKHYLLDVRINRAENKWEKRHFIYFSFDIWHGDIIRCLEVGDVIGYTDNEDHNKRLRDGLHEFADLVTDTHYRDRAAYADK